MDCVLLRLDRRNLQISKRKLARVGIVLGDDSDERRPMHSAPLPERTALRKRGARRGLKPLRFSGET